MEKSQKKLTLVSEADIGVRPSGLIVVDEHIITSDYSEMKSHLKIKTFTIFSHHKSLELTLNFTLNQTKVIKPLHDSFDKTPLRYKVTSNSKEDFQKSIMEDETKRRCDGILPTAPQ